MQSRASYQKAAPEVYQSMLALHATVQKSDLPTGLVNLVYYRVSQINGCAFCLDMHSKDLRAHGETEQRLYMITHGARPRTSMMRVSARPWPGPKR